jgi:Bacterial Ig-like domain (group 2)
MPAMRTGEEAKSRRTRGTMSSTNRGRTCVMSTALGLCLSALMSCGGGSDVGPGSIAGLTLSPPGLTLPVGGQGTLAAEVRDANGAVVSNPNVAWASLNQAVASVSNAGIVTGHVVGLTQVIATAVDKADTADIVVVDQLTLEVAPGLASVAVGGTVQFTVIARDGSGQEIPAPPVTWTSSSTPIATIDGTGTATGVTVGQTNITASAGQVTSPPATLNVSDTGPAACDGIASVTNFDGSLDYDYVISGNDQSDRRVESEYHGQLTAKLTHIVPGGPIFETWQGPLEGTASVHETLTDPTTGESDRFEGGGPIIQSISGVFQSVMSLIVNLTTCTYMLGVNPAIHVTHFEFGTRREADEQVVQVQIGRDTPLGAWKTLHSIANPGYNIDAHPVTWAAEHLGLDAFSPLGFANELFATDPDAPQGAATVSYALFPK